VTVPFSIVTLKISSYRHCCDGVTVVTVVSSTFLEAYLSASLPILQRPGEAE
jgi:hypothetical protein